MNKISLQEEATLFHEVKKLVSPQFLFHSRTTNSSSSIIKGRFHTDPEEGFMTSCEYLIYLALRYLRHPDKQIKTENLITLKEQVRGLVHVIWAMDGVIPKGILLYDVLDQTPSTWMAGVKKIINGKEFIVDTTYDQETTLMFVIAMSICSKIPEVAMQVRAISRIVYNKLRIPISISYFGYLNFISKYIISKYMNYRITKFQLSVLAMYIFLIGRTIGKRGHSDYYSRHYYLVTSLWILHNFSEMSTISAMRRIKVLPSEHNFYAMQIENEILCTSHPRLWDSPGAKVISGLPWGENPVKWKTPVPFECRSGYNFWKTSPYIEKQTTIGDQVHGNLAYLLAYWI